MKGFLFEGWEDLLLSSLSLSEKQYQSHERDFTIVSLFYTTMLLQ